MDLCAELVKLDAQKKKLQGLCDEHDLVYKLDIKQYPIVLTISKATKQYEQQQLIPDEKAEPACDPDAKIVWTFKESTVSMKVEGGTFTIGKELRTKIENIFLKIVSFWLQYFFRKTLEDNLLKKNKFPDVPDVEEELKNEGEPVEAAEED